MLQDPPDEGAEHVPRDTIPADYGSNPPTSGIHTPEWASDGIYGPNDTPELGNLVHTLEHGRIDVQYKPGTPPATITALTKWVKSQDGGYHMLLFQNTTADALRGRRDRLGPPDRLPAVQRQGHHGAEVLPRGATSTRARKPSRRRAMRVRTPTLYSASVA